MSFFSPSYPRFLILVFYTKFCTRHFAHVISNLHSHLIRQVLPSSFHIWGNWASKRFANFSKVTQWISGWPHFSMEPLPESLIHGLVLEGPALSYFALPLTLILFWLSTTVFAWIPVETEGAMRGGQIWDLSSKVLTWEIEAGDWRRQKSQRLSPHLQPERAKQQWYHQKKWVIGKPYFCRLLIRWWLEFQWLFPPWLTVAMLLVFLSLSFLFFPLSIILPDSHVCHWFAYQMM